MDHDAGTHFHIRWHDGSTARIDWEPFPSRDEAERLAKKLAKTSETFQVVEESDASCPKCEMFRRGKNL